MINSKTSGSLELNESEFRPAGGPVSFGVLLGGGGGGGDSGQRAAVRGRSPVMAPRPSGCYPRLPGRFW